MSSSSYIKDPDAILDYQVNWADWLSTGDTIQTATVTVSAGDVVKDSQSNTANTVTVWLSGGTVDTEARVNFRVVTAQGRTDDRSILLLVRQR